MTITDDMVERAARAMWDVWQQSAICKDEHRGISWDTIKENVGSNRAATGYYETGLKEARAALVAALQQPQT